jgi:hypothetical protein
VGEEVEEQEVLEILMQHHQAQVLVVQEFLLHILQAFQLIWLVLVVHLDQESLVLLMDLVEVLVVYLLVHLTQEYKELLT